MRGIDTSRLERKSQALTGFLVWIVEGVPQGRSKSELETLAYEHGANICQGTPLDLDDGRTTRVTIGGKPNAPSTDNARKAGLYVLSPAWLLDSIQTGSPLVYEGKGAAAEYVIMDPYAGDDGDDGPAAKKRKTAADRTVVTSQASSARAPVVIDDDDADTEEEMEQDQAFERQVERSDFFGGGGSIFATAQSMGGLSLGDERHRPDGYYSTDDEMDGDDDDARPLKTGDAIDTPFNHGAADGMEGDESVDPDKYYAPRVFYLDTLENAQTLGSYSDDAPPLSVESPAWRHVVDELEEHGGRVTTNIDDPTLTHVIVQLGQYARVRKLQQRVAGKGRARRFVTTEWIDECRVRRLTLSKFD